MNTNFGSDVKAIKYPAGIYGRTGTSDIIACCKGRFVIIECKRLGEEPEKIQEHEGKKFIAAGGLWFCVSSLQEVKDVILPLLGAR